MNVDVKTVSNSQKQLTITVPGTLVQTEMDRAFRSLARNVQIRGFRKGKVPQRILEARFGDRVRSDVASTLIQSGFSDALTSQDIQPISQPQLTDTDAVVRGQDFCFTVTVEVRPDIELKNYTGMDVVFPAVDVNDEEVEMAVNMELQRQARVVEVTDRASEAGDNLLTSLRILDGDEEVLSEPGTMVRTSADPYYRGIESLLIGEKAGSDVSGEVTFADDAMAEGVAGKTLTVEAKILSIQTMEAPELTDEVAGELDYEGGVKGMRSTIRMRMEATRTENSRNQARANLLEVIIASNPLDVPNGMIESSLSMLKQELQYQQAMQTGQDPASITFAPSQLADLRARAEFAAQSSLILEFVGKKENVEVADADLDQKMNELAEQQGQNIELIKGYFNTQERLDDLRARLQEEKTLDWLLERANLVAPSPADDAPAKAAPAKKKKAAKKSTKAKAEPAAPAAGGGDLSAMKVGELKALAKERGLKGYSKMKRADLIEALS
jgi:trigger factor